MMRKFKFRATLRGEIRIEDDNKTLDNIESEIKHVIYCTLEDGNCPDYLDIGYNNKITFKEIVDD